MSPVEAAIRAAELTLFRRCAVAPAEMVARPVVDKTPVQLRALAFGDGPPVLCLHAASWFAAHWAPLCALLRGRRVYCVDMPGHGLSDGIDYSGRDLRTFQVDLFRQVMAELGLQGVPIVGNSLGGMTALWLALDAPALVSRVSILGVPATALPGARPDLILSILSVPWLNRLVLALPASAWTSRAALRNALGAGASGDIPPEMFTIHALTRRRREFVATIASWMPETHVWRGGRSSVAIPDVELAELRQPTLFLWGEDDVFGSARIARRAASLIPDARVETLPTGHHPQLTAVEQCARSLNRFLG